jgi:hypothetical protein
VVTGAEQRRAAPALAMPRRCSRDTSSNARFFSFFNKKNHNLHGIRHVARVIARGLGGSTLLSTRHQLPRPAPRFPHLGEARCTKHNFEKPGVRSVPRAQQANQTGENIRVYRYTKLWVFIISDTYFSSVAPNHCRSVEVTVYRLQKTVPVTEMATMRGV